MSAPFEIKGWCPGALRPMESGDGLVVRVRPRAGSLSPEVTRAIALGARRHGNGLIDLTSRANLQIRGVSHAHHGPLVAELAACGLIDAHVASEERRNILVTPFGEGPARAGTEALAAELERRLADGPDLPGKFGFAVDTGLHRVLADAPADIRIERDGAGALLVRADGTPAGRPVTPANAVDLAIALAHWFLASGGVVEGRGRMARHLAGGARLPADLHGDARPAPSMPVAAGACAEGLLVGAAFGQLEAETLALLADRGSVLRVTPWRMLLLAGARAAPSMPGLILRGDDPALRVSACTGAPACPQALAPTRDLARALAPHVPPGRHLHVSGCAKGCAHPGPASVTLCATGAGFDLIRDGSARAAPVRTGLSEAALRANPAFLFEPA